MSMCNINLQYHSNTDRLATKDRVLSLHMLALRHFPRRRATITVVRRPHTNEPFRRGEGARDSFPTEDHHRMREEFSTIRANLEKRRQALLNKNSEAEPLPPSSEVAHGDSLDIAPYG